MSILAKIKEHKIEEVGRLKAGNLWTRFETACRDAPPRRDFVEAIAIKYARKEVALIAEIKRESPSKGVLSANFDVSKLARAYFDGGAACLSVVTDARFFGGSGSHIAQARSISGLPVLRKDFILDPIQVVETRAMGADCILLILAMLEPGQAEELEAAAIEVGLDVLIEVHDDAELDRALGMQSPLVGVNNRNLTTFEADVSVSELIARRIGNDRLVISESGLVGPEDVKRLLRGGIHGFLIGESLLIADDIQIATRNLTDCWKETRHERASAGH